MVWLAYLELLVVVHDDGLPERPYSFLVFVLFMTFVASARREYKLNALRLPDEEFIILRSSVEYEKTLLMMLAEGSRIGFCCTSVENRCIVHKVYVYSLSYFCRVVLTER